MSQREAQAAAAAVRTQLKASSGSDAQVLEQLATARDLGAPARPRQAQGGLIRPSDDRSSASAALSAVVTAAGEGGGGSFRILELALLGITLALLRSGRRHIRG